MRVFIHGDHWRAPSKSDFALVAPAFNTTGAMGVPDYAVPAAVTVERISCARPCPGVTRFDVLDSGCMA